MLYSKQNVERLRGNLTFAHSLFCLIFQQAVSVQLCTVTSLITSSREEELEEVCLSKRPHGSSGGVNKKLKVSFSNSNCGFQTDSSFSRGCFYNFQQLAKCFVGPPTLPSSSLATPTCSVISACLSWESISIFL